MPPRSRISAPFSPTDASVPLPSGLTTNLSGPDVGDDRGDQHDRGRADRPCRVDLHADRRARARSCCPETTWTPTGAGPIRFSLAAPGSASAAGTTLPYGSVFLSLGTEGAPATLDCAPAAIAIANDAIPWSDAGRNGSAGRYAIEANPARPVFACAVNSQQPPVETPTPTATASPDPQPTASPIPPAATPDAHARRQGAGRADRLVAADRVTRRADRAPAVLPAGLLDLPRHDRRQERGEDQARQALEDRHADAPGALHTRARQAADRDAEPEQGRARGVQAHAVDRRAGRTEDQRGRHRHAPDHGDSAARIVIGVDDFAQRAERRSQAGLFVQARHPRPA